jgi:hypothetical protein
LIPTFADRMSFANFTNPYRNLADVKRNEAETIVAAAKARVERMILEEVSDG